MPVVDVLPLSGTLILDKNKLRTLPPFVCTVFKGSGGIGTYSRVDCFCDMARFFRNDNPAVRSRNCRTAPNICSG